MIMNDPLKRPKPTVSQWVWIILIAFLFVAPGVFIASDKTFYFSSARKLNSFIIALTLSGPLLLFFFDRAAKKEAEGGSSASRSRYDIFSVKGVLLFVLGLLLALYFLILTAWIPVFLMERPVYSEQTHKVRAMKYCARAKCSCRPQINVSPPVQNESYLCVDKKTWSSLDIGDPVIIGGWFSTHVSQIDSIRRAPETYSESPPENN